MKQVSPQLKTYLDSIVAGANSTLIVFQLYTIQLTNGSSLYVTSAPFPITAADTTIFSPKDLNGDPIWYPGIVWSPIIVDENESDNTAVWCAGLDSNSWHTKFCLQPSDTLNDIPIMSLGISGVFDFADVIVSSVYFDEPPSWNVGSKYCLNKGPINPLGSIVQFRGYVGKIETSDSTSLSLKLMDWRSILQENVPKNIYTNTCRHIFGDHRCTLNRESLKRVGFASSRSTNSVIVSKLPITDIQTKFGVLTFTTGLNTGLSRLVVSDSTTEFQLLMSFPFSIMVDDQFDISPGCTKTLDSCQSYNNTLNYGGNPFIPIPEVTYT